MAAPVLSMPVVSRLLEVGVVATSLVMWRQAALAIVCDDIDADAALLHALSPRVPLETAGVRGLPLDLLAQSSETWDHLGAILGALRHAANERGVVSLDDEARPRSRARATYDRIIGRPTGLRSMMIAHLVVREQVVAALLLFRRRPRAFGHDDVARLHSIRPALAAIDALQQHLDGGPRSRAPRQLRCVDQRLTPRQREVVECVARGMTNADIAIALDMSVHGVRNHLVRIMQRVDAQNRADLVRVSVLLPTA